MMKGMSWNLALALAWVGMTGAFNAANLVIGFIVGYVVLLILRGPVAMRGHLFRLWRSLDLLAFFAWEMLLANLRVAWDVVTPTHLMQPGVIAVPLDARDDIEILILANMVSLTPGTLSLDLSDDRTVLYIHAMYLHDRERIIRGIKNGFERRLLEVLR
jgi:multicomponent Na+:H+ antiporter subunit E